MNTKDLIDNTALLYKVAAQHPSRTQTAFLHLTEKLWESSLSDEPEIRNVATKIEAMLMIDCNTLGLNSQASLFISNLISQEQSLHSLFDALVSDRTLNDLEIIRPHAQEAFITFALAGLEENTNSFSLEENFEFDNKLLGWASLWDTPPHVSPRLCLQINNYVLDHLVDYERNNLPHHTLPGLGNHYILGLATRLYVNMNKAVISQFGKVEKNKVIVDVPSIPLDEKEACEQTYLSQMGCGGFNRASLETFIEKYIHVYCALADEGFTRSPDRGLTHLDSLLPMMENEPRTAAAPFSTEGLLKKLEASGFPIEKSRELSAQIDDCFKRNKVKMAAFPPIARKGMLRVYTNDTPSPNETSARAHLSIVRKTDKKNEP